MEQYNWSDFRKPYDLRERLFDFACVVTRLVKYLRTQGSIAFALSDQVLRAANSKEVIFRLRVLRAADYLGPEHDPVIQEAIELKRIVAIVIRNSRT